MHVKRKICGFFSQIFFNIRSDSSESDGGIKKKIIKLLEELVLFFNFMLLKNTCNLHDYNGLYL